MLTKIGSWLLFLQEGGVNQIERAIQRVLDDKEMQVRVFATISIFCNNVSIEVDKMETKQGECLAKIYLGAVA